MSDLAKFVAAVLKDKAVEELLQENKKLHRIIRALPPREFKLLLLGDRCVGKTSLIRHHLGDDVHRTERSWEEYERTPYFHLDNNSEKPSLLFHTSHGPVQFNVWDTSLSQLFCEGGPRNRHYFTAQCAILMFDLTKGHKFSYVNLAQYHKDMTSAPIDGNIPMVVVGNKLDNCKDQKTKPPYITFPQKKNLDYYPVSVKARVNLDLPFLSLARKLLQDESLQFL